MITRASKGEYSTLVQESASRTMHPESWKDNELVAVRNRMVAEYGAEKFIAHVTATRDREERYNALKNTDIPVLIVISKEDQVMFNKSYKTSSPINTTGLDHTSLS